jgi:DNA mismatch repair protein MutS2
LNYPANIEAKLGFDRIRQLAEQLCLCGLGRINIQQLEFSCAEHEVASRLRQVAEFKQICLFEDSFPADNFIDLSTCLLRIRLEGSYIYLQELHQLRLSLKTIYSLLQFFATQERQAAYPVLSQMAAEIEQHKEILPATERLIDENGEMRDSASAQLAGIRQAIRSKMSQLQRIMQNMLRAAVKEGYCDEGTTLAMRDGRAVIPVKSSLKRKIEGYVHDESATGKTAYVEPAESFEANNEISRLQQEEKAEIARILREFTSWLRPYLPSLELSYIFMGQIDSARARGLLAAEIGGFMPEISAQPGLLLEQARHPLLCVNFKKEGRQVVPMRMELNPAQRILLISGPNAGGKSVCMKAAGLLVYMAQTGFLPTAHEASRIGLFRQVFIDIGDDQSMDNDLSTYSSHLSKMKHFLSKACTGTLFLIDEFGTGTEPMLGGAIAQAILAALNNKGAWGVVTTHYTNLKHFASSASGLVNGAMLFDSEQMRPMYKLRMGAAGSSFAFEIARSMGLPHDTIKAAEEIVGAEHVNFDRNLKDLEKEKQHIFKKKQELYAKEQKIDGKLASIESRESETSSKKQQILETARKEAADILAQANRTVERTIKEIVEGRAEKERTREARKMLELAKIENEQQARKEASEIARKMENLRQKQQDRQNRKANPGAKPDHAPKTESPEAEKPLQPGDSVRLKGQTGAGEVLEVYAKNATVAFGLMRTVVAIERLEPISRAELKKQNRDNRQASSSATYKLSEKRLNFKPEIDVRGQRADEAMMAVRDFVEQGIMLGMNNLQVLHGKGNGILRSQIRDLLKSDPAVASCADAHPDHGGAGITVIELS